MPRTTPTNGLNKATFLGVSEVRKGPPYESEVKLTNFVFSWQNGEFWWGQKCCTHLLTQNEELSKKKLERVNVYTRAYTHVGMRIRVPIFCDFSSFLVW